MLLLFKITALYSAAFVVYADLGANNAIYFLE
jgi:hypothetical protein